MSEKVAVTLKVDPMVRAGLQVLARHDRRTMSSYVESWVDHEVKDRKISIEEIDAAMRPKPFGVLSSDVVLPDYVDQETFNDWAEYKKETHKTKITVSWMKYTLREFAKARENGWDVNELMAEAMTKGWKGCVFDKHVKERCEDVIDENESSSPEEEVRRREYAKLKSYQTPGVCSKALWDQFIEMMYQSSHPLTFTEASKAFSRLIAFASWDQVKIEKFMEWMIGTESFELNEEGCFLMMEEMK